MRWLFRLSSLRTCFCTAAFSASDGCILWNESSSGISMAPPRGTDSYNPWDCKPVPLLSSLFFSKPNREILKRPVAHGLLAILAFDLFVERRKEPEIHIHGLEAFRVGAASNVRQQRAQRGGGRRRQMARAARLGRREAPRQQSHRGAFDIAFHARHLPGEADMGTGLEPQFSIQQKRR